MNMQEQPQRGKWYQSRLTWVLLGFIAIGGFFLVTEQEMSSPRFTEH